MPDSAFFYKKFHKKTKKILKNRKNREFFSYIHMKEQKTPQFIKEKEKTMKKLICLLLVILMTCSTLAGCVHQDADLRMKKAYLRQFGIKDVEPEDVVIDYDGGTYNGARIVMLDAERHNPEERTETVSDIVIQYYDANCLYVYKNEKFYTLVEAYENSILLSNDIVSIAVIFNEEVTHFRDTCDKYDFPKGKILEVDERNNDRIAYHSIYIYLDVYVCKSAFECKDLFDYLSSDDITNVAFIYHGVNHKEFPDYYSTMLMAELKEQTKESADRVMEEIVQIPGVWGVSYFYPVGFPAQVTNGSYSSDEYSWINDIKVEKVWDFTMGSSSVNVDGNRIITRIIR